jgi:hypothetical protein
MINVSHTEIQNVFNTAFLIFLRDITGFHPAGRFLLDILVAA